MKRSLRIAAIGLACVSALSATATAAEAKTLDIVLLGDSYTSGNGAGSYTDTSCYRSSQNWGERYARAVRATGTTVTVNNRACSGGVVTDLDEQMKGITADTDLVAVTIGGNDVGFVNIVVQCFSPVVADPARCKTAISSGKSKLPGVQAAALQRLSAVKARLRPGAKVIVLSYPYLANNKGYILRGLFNSFNAGKAVRDLGDAGDQTVIAAGAAANAAAGTNFVEFIPTKDLFVGHEPNPDPWVDASSSWIWEFTGWFGPLDIYHPKPAGQLAMSQAIVRKAGPTLDFGLAQ